VVDGGPEFRSTYFETLLARYECIKKVRPKAKARFGSVCERLFGTTNTQFIYNLEGNTQITKDVRQVTKSVNPKGKATWPLANLYDRLCEYEYQVYDQIDHPALGETPRNAFVRGRASTGLRPHRFIPYDEDFLMATRPATPKGTAKLLPGRGVKIHHLYYWSENFRNPDFENTQLKVRYDPFDIGTAFALVKNRWVRCHSEYYTVFRRMTSEPPPNRITAFVPEEIKRTCNGNVNEFARLVNVNNMTVYSWCYDRAVPQNDLILKVCFATGKSYVDVLTGKDSPSVSELAGRQTVPTLLIPGLRRHTSGEVRRALLAALTVAPPCSFREVSNSLGYKSDFLSVKYPDLCGKIVERYRIYSRTQSRHAQTPEPDDQAVESSLRRALEEPIPPSLQQIGKELGYPDRHMGRRRFEKKFPNLCKAISDRRKSYLSSRRESIKTRVKRFLELEPPPTLDEATELLGFKDPNHLRKCYPELCRSIVQRNSKYRQAKFNSLRDKLRAIFREQEPISLRAAAARLGKNPAYLGSRFPEACKPISRRY
jgi:hypothetical protein